jgi:hypothetical protein
MSHRKTDLGIPCRSKSAKVVLGPVDKSQNGLLCDFAMYARTLLEEKRTTEGPDVELARGGPFCNTCFAIDEVFDRGGRR